MDLYLSLLMSAQDGVSSVLASIGGNFGPLGAAMAGVGAAAIEMGAQTVQATGQYQQSMNMVESLTGSTTAQMQNYDAGVKQLSDDTGVAANQLTQGLYFMTSAGYSGSDALKMLTLSTKDSVIGMTDSTTTANGLSTVMRGFGRDISYADETNGEMLRTVTSGKMTMQDYAGAVAKSSSVAVQYGDTMEDMNSVLATLTSNGVKSAAIAATDYDNLLKVLQGNTQSVITKSKALDPAFDGNAYSAMTVSEKIQYLNTQLTQHGININDVIGKQQNAAAAYTILSQHANMYATNLKNLSDQQANANATQQDWTTTQQGFDVTVNRLNATFGNLEITVGSALLPILTQLLGFVANAIDGFTTWVTQTGALQSAANGLSAMLSGLSTIIQESIGEISSVFDGLPSMASTWGGNLVTGFADGIVGSQGVVTEAINGIINEVAGFIGFESPTEQGPGQNVDVWGKNMIVSFANGITDNIDLVTGAVSQIAGAASSGLTDSSIASSVANGGVINMSGMTIQQAKQVEALIKQNEQLQATQAKTQASTATSAAATTANVTKQASTTTSVTAKHASALAKHQAVVEAATQKHNQVLAREAANAAKRQETAQASAAKKGAKSATDGASLGDIASLPAKAQAVGAQSASSLASGLASGASAIKMAMNAEWGNIIVFARVVFSSLIQIIGPIISIAVQIVAGLWHTLLVLGETVAQNLLPSLTTLLVAITPIIAGFLKWIASSGMIQVAFTVLQVAIQVVVGVLSTLITAVASIIYFFSQTQLGVSIFQALLVLLGAIALVIGVVAAVIFASMVPALVASGIAAIATGIGMALAFAPVTLIVLGIIAVITLVILIIKNWGNIGTWLQGIWGAVMSWFSSSLTSLKTWWSGVWSGMLSIGKSILDGIVNIVKIGGAAILLAIFGPIIAVVALFEWLYNHNYYFKNLVDSITNFFKGCFTWLNQQWSSFVNWLANLWQGLSAKASTLWQQVSDTVQQKTGQAGNWIKSNWDTATTNTKNFMQEAQSVIVEGWQKISSLFMMLWNTYIGPGLSYALTSASNALQGFVSQAYNSGLNFVMMLARGITGGVNWIWNAVVGIANTIWKALGFHSPPAGGPLADSDTYMPNLIKLLSSGLVAGVPQMQSAVNQVAQPMQTTLAQPVSSSTNTGGTVNGGGNTTHTYNITVPAVSTNNTAAARAQGQAIGQALAQRLRGGAMTPTLVSGGLQ